MVDNPESVNKSESKKCIFRSLKLYSYLQLQLSPPSWNFTEAWLQWILDVCHVRTMQSTRSTICGRHLLYGCEALIFMCFFLSVVYLMKQLCGFINHAVCDTCRLQTCRLADLQTCRLADLQTCRLADLQTCRLADLWTCRLADL